MNRAEWFDFADVDAILFDGFSEGVLMVDIGGGRGHDLEAFGRKFPERKEGLVLQDLPPVIEDIGELSLEIVRMGYDFFGVQPVKGKSGQMHLRCGRLTLGK